MNDELIDGSNTDIVIGVENTDNTAIAAENVDNDATDAEILIMMQQMQKIQIML